MGQYHPHGDTAIYDTLVRLAQPWVMRAPLVHGQGNFGSPGNDPAAAMRYTECRMAPLAMEMVRDIDEDTVDFQPNYDGRSQEPTVLPARFPNLLVNGSAGIAVGMATNIPPHNLREVAEGAQWALEHPDATREELQDALVERIKGPDFPNGALIVGREGIEQAYRTGRGSVTQRAVIEIDEDNKGRTCLSITELPYMVNPDNLALKIAELADSGKVQGIADVRDDSSGAHRPAPGRGAQARRRRPGRAQQPAQAHRAADQLQRQHAGAGRRGAAHADRSTSSSATGSPTRSRSSSGAPASGSREAERQAHIYRGLVKALDVLDEVIALIRRSPDVEEARQGLMELLEIDEIQANAILDMQLRRLAALERQKIIDRLAELEAVIADLEDILANEARQRQIISEELAEIVEKFGNERRTQIIAADGDLSMEDLIPDEDLVVTITRGGYAKRTRADQYRTQKRGGKGVRGATLRGDDVVEHFIATTNHHWLLFFTTAGRVYRTKAYNLPEARATPRAATWPGCCRSSRTRTSRRCWRSATTSRRRTSCSPPATAWSRRPRLGDYNSPRQAGVIAINFREDDDELIGAELVYADDDILLVSRKGQAIRFRADDTQLRPMGRATSRRDGHEVPRRRLAAVDVGDPRRAGGGRGGRRGRGRRAGESVERSPSRRAVPR